MNLKEGNDERIVGHIVASEIEHPANLGKVGEQIVRDAPAFHPLLHIFQFLRSRSACQFIGHSCGRHGGNARTFMPHQGKRIVLKDHSLRLVLDAGEEYIVCLGSHHIRGKAETEAGILFCLPGQPFADVGVLALPHQPERR